MDLILTSKLGTFTFNKHTLLAHAKLIRDSVTGQFFNPRTNEQRVVDEETAQTYVDSHLGQTLEGIPFNLDVNPQ